MPKYMPPNNETDFAPPPSGTHIAVCYRVIDLGTQQIEWQGQIKQQRKIMIGWELPDEKMEDGRPFTISRRYTYSSSERSTMRQHLEAWRGKRFEDHEFGPGGFDISKIIGKGCLLTIVHNTKDGRTFANIAGVGGMPKGVATPETTNTPLFFDLDEFDGEMFNSLSEGLRNVISKSPEYAEATRGNGHATTYNDRSPPPADLDDSIPF